MSCLYRKALVVVGLVFCLFSPLFAYSGGSGIETDPYQISNVSDWQQLKNTSTDWSKHFIMISDVNLQGIALTPVGSNYDYSFTGVFDGNGHTIRKAKINMPSSYYVGLFGYVGASGQIRNLCIEDVNVRGYEYVGGLVGWNNGGAISDCCATSLVTGNSSNSGHVGGLVGCNQSGTITDCCVTGVVSGNEYVGGVVGDIWEGTITNCYVAGVVSGIQYVGGLVGVNEGGAVTDCCTSCMVNGDMGAGGFGGLVGGNSGSISTCYATGTVTGEWIMGVGGLVGDNSGSISTCYATGAVTGNMEVGGLVGTNSYGTITACYSTGTVNGYIDVGGLVGGSGENISITDSYATGTVNGDSIVGGLVGMNSGSSTISGCYAAGDVNGTGCFIGGLVGSNRSSISACYSTGSVSGSGVVGGLVGDNRGSISACYVAGAVSGNDSVGGLVGENYGGDITACYAIGAVSGSYHVGGLVGNNDGSVSSSFWDTQTSGQPTSAGGEGKTTAEMQDIDTYVNANWDFSYTDGDPADWFIQIDEYPILTWQISPADIYTDGRNNFRDFAVFAKYWLRQDCSIYNYYCDWADLDFSGDVGIEDLRVLMSYWLEEGIYN